MSDSLITKRAMGTALKELCLTKSFHKITIADITGKCGLNRQSFYYHFQDKFELLNWVYYNEAFSKVVQGVNLENWNEHLLRLLKIMKQDQKFYTSTIKDQEQNFSEYLFQSAHSLLMEGISILAKNEVLTEHQRKTYADFFAYGITGILVSWARNGMQESPEQMASLMKSLVENGEKAAYHKYIRKSLGLQDEKL